MSGMRSVGIARLIAGGWGRARLPDRGCTCSLPPKKGEKQSVRASRDREKALLLASALRNRANKLLRKFSTHSVADGRCCRQR
eukprot:1164081-Prymnesium_polylepis.1